MATYEIIIKDETSGVGTNTPNNTPNPPSNPNSPSGDNTLNTTDGYSNKFSAKAITKMSFDIANQLVISKIGEISRNSLTQQKINAVASIISVGISFAVNPIMGAIHLSSNVANEVITYSLEQSKEMSRNAVMYQRAGYINRSRN